MVPLPVGAWPNLWLTDGTAGGTHELTGITGVYAVGIFGGQTSFAPDFTSFNGEVLFRGVDANSQAGLWVTGGAAAGTHELTDISNANANGSFSQSFPAFTILNGEVLFDGMDAAGNFGLWETNGTAVGTNEITGISGAFSGGLFHGLSGPDMVVFNNEVLFDGLDASNQTSLWVTNGTAAGTHELTGISGAYTGSGGLFGASTPLTNLGGPRGPDFTVYSGEVLFNATDAAEQNGLWVTDGTAAGTHEITGISGANAYGVDPSFLTVFKHEVLFNGFDAAGNRGLWVTNGTAASTHELTGIVGASTSGSGFNPTDFTVFKGKVLFDGVDAAGNEGLWVTDGTAAGTHELTGIKGAYSGGLAPSDFTVINNKEVLFDGVDASGNHNLWATNGTVAGTHEVNLTGASSSGLNLNDLTVVSLTDPKNAAVVCLTADAFHFAPDLGNGTNANAGVHSDPVVTNAQAADLAALMTDAHQGAANTVMAYDGHETTHLDQVAQSHLHAANFHLI